jgi:DNA-binding NarL/FixJ family response regulator
VRTKKVAVIDEHDVFRCGIVTILREDPWLDVVYVGSESTADLDVDVIVASPSICRNIHVGCPVLVCWGPSDPPLSNTYCAGAIVERDDLSAEDLIGFVWALSTGLRLEHNGAHLRAEMEIDKRCRHILQLLSEGADTRGISQSLCYSERTVKGLIRGIEERLSAANRAEAVAKAIRLGLI